MIHVGKAVLDTFLGHFSFFFFFFACILPHHDCLYSCKSDASSEGSSWAGWMDQRGSFRFCERALHTHTRFIFCAYFLVLYFSFSFFPFLCHTLSTSLCTYLPSLNIFFLYTLYFMAFGKYIHTYLSAHIQFIAIFSRCQEVTGDLCLHC